MIALHASIGSSTCCVASMTVAIPPRWRDQALPVLMSSRSPSPFLREDRCRGRSPGVKVLLHSGQPLAAGMQPKTEAEQRHLIVYEVTSAKVQPTREPQQINDDDVGLLHAGGETVNQFNLACLSQIKSIGVRGNQPKPRDTK